MSDDLARRSHAVFCQAMDMEARERDRFLEHACKEDEALRRRVRSLLGALDQTNAFLDAPALSTSGIGPASPIALQAFDRIGGFEILGVIGAGGMATVYQAMQNNPRRRVALKVMKHGLTNSAARQRFEFETEVLARLKHRGIAQIYEAGTHRDAAGHSLPYFAMEYIADALPITAFADDRRLDLRSRLRLFTEVCEAVQHGHQNGVIHRDLKPGNILIDGTGAPKVIDFGVARSTDPEHAWITHESGLGQLIGTLNYMSPEQCAGESIDVRSDVYALGMVLYELLCGDLPHDLTRVPLPEALRIVRQEPPRRPSSRSPTLRGDLEAIILKAIDKDPDRRYVSTAALGADIHRYLHHETIEARPPTFAYQCRLFALRHRALVAAMGAIAATLVIATIVSARLAMWATLESRERLNAEQQALRDRDAAIWRTYVTSIAAATAAHQSREYHAMRTSLQSAPLEHRNWEWRFLSALANPEIQRINAHDNMVLNMAASDDGALLASVAWDGTVHVWNARTRGFIASCDGHEALVLGVAFSPDSTRLATGSDDRTIRTWHALTGQPIRRIPVDRRVTSMVWTRDGQLIAAMESGPAQIWNAETGEHVGEISDQPGDIQGLALSPDGLRLMTWNEVGLLWVRSTDGRATHTRLDFGDKIECAAMSNDGSLIAAGGLAGRITVWKAREGGNERRLKIPGSESLVRSVIFAPDDRTMAAGLGDRSIVVWEVDTTVPIAQHLGHDDAITRLLFIDGGRQLLSCSSDHTIRVWDTAGAADLRSPAILDGHSDRVIAAAFSADGSMVASGSVDGTVRLWDPYLQECLGTLKGHAEAVYGVAFSPDGRLLASASHDDTVRIWNAWTGQELRVLPEHNDDVWSVAFSPDGRHMASAGDDRVMRLWDLESGKTVQTFSGHRERVTCVAFSPDGQTIASTSRDHDAIIWNARTGAVIHALKGHRSDVFCTAFNRDGSLLYTGSRDQTVRVWNTRTGVCEHVFDEHGQWITSLSLSADGTRLAGASWFGEIVLMDLRTREVVASFKAHQEVIRAVAFDPRGRWLASASYDRTVRLFDHLLRDDRTRACGEARALRERGTKRARELCAAALTPNGAAELAQRDASIEPEMLPWIRKGLLRISLQPELEQQDAVPGADDAQGHPAGTALLVPSEMFRHAGTTPRH